jgi:hypothetical protein
MHSGAQQWRPSRARSKSELPRRQANEATNEKKRAVQMNKIIQVMVSVMLALPVIATSTDVRAQTAQTSVTITASGTTVFTCGSTYQGVAVTCTGGTGVSTRPVRAREIDAQFAITGMVLVLGCLAILRARKRP